MDVKEAFIPDLFTEKNRLIVATPNRNVAKPTIVDESSSSSSSSSQINNNTMGRFGQMPPLNTVKNDASANTNMINSKSRFLKGFYVPCKDDNESRSIIFAISGRVAAVKRKEIMHNRNHHGIPQLDISLWLPGNGTEISEESIVELILSKHPNVKCSVSKHGDVYTDSRTLRTSMTFRILYGANDDGDGVLAFEEANTIHKSLYQSIPSAFPGAECR